MRPLSRREFLGQATSAAAGLALGPLACRSACAPSFWRGGGSARGPNVLFLSIDDLNDWAGPFGGYPGVHTPHIDALAARGTSFQRAYCSVPACGGSRSSLLSGIAPHRTGFYLQEHLLDYGEDYFTKRGLMRKTLPRAFRERGYRTLGGGKLFHAGYGDRGFERTDLSKSNVDGNAWSEPYQFLYLDDVTPNYRGWNRESSGLVDLFGPAYDDDEAAMPDRRLATWAAEQLARPGLAPFFLAAGFYRPHIDWRVPQRYFDLYPLEGVRVPDHSVEAADLADVPAYARERALDEHGDQAGFDAVPGSQRRATQAYLASISFADACVGSVLDALSRSEYAADTLVVLWSDHGWHLGEKLGWRKFKLWEKAARVPLVIAGPGVAAGARCERVVSLLDLYPTLADVCFSDSSPYLDGRSLRPLLEAPTADWPGVALTGWMDLDRRVSRSVRSQRWRYIEYPDGSEELYDLATDGEERTNLLHPMHGQQRAHQEIRDELRAALPS